MPYNLRTRKVVKDHGILKIKYKKTCHALEDKLRLRKLKMHCRLSRFGYELWYIIKKDLRISAQSLKVVNGLPIAATPLIFSRVSFVLSVIRGKYL